MDDEERRVRKAAASRARRQDPEVRAREAAAKRARRQADLEAVRAREAAAKRARRQADPVAVRAKDAAAKRAQRGADPETVRAKKAAAKRAQREADPGLREREAAAKRARRRADPDAARAREAAAKRLERSRFKGADARFQRDFLAVSFGHSCDVYDRLWFANNLVPVSGFKSDSARENAIAVLRREFPAADTEYGEYKFLSGDAIVGHTPRPSHCSETDHDNFTAEPEHEAAPGLHRESGKAGETSPEPACEPLRVTDKSVQVRLLTHHEASQANEEKILSTSATQTEPQALSSGSLALVFLEQSSSLASVRDRLHSCHKKERSFSCVHCNASFVMKCQLVKHMLIHPGERPFTCVHCNASFSQKYHLVSHMRVHSGERSFSCVHCNASFSAKRTLDSHMRTHSAEHSFCCVHCNASFGSKSHLVEHIRMHTEERPFSCFHCNASFSRKCHLTVHVSRRHANSKP
ncbi:zinc finger protein 501-like isoform X6 [Rhipicephalus sanguineus]|uniref:zinc finger protein 501-like isoform X6 n=1 Tax=Rhipicephalus sanguineus TaxID=34632 RepID=UPI0020C4AA8D|nr:zinc finger protein 501-like isoform X6 [Rhipicephalus sanguineus]